MDPICCNIVLVFQTCTTSECSSCDRAARTAPSTRCGSIKMPSFLVCLVCCKCSHKYRIILVCARCPTEYSRTQKFLSSFSLMINTKMPHNVQNVFLNTVSTRFFYTVMLTTLRLFVYPNLRVYDLHFFCVVLLIDACVVLAFQNVFCIVCARKSRLILLAFLRFIVLFDNFDCHFGKHFSDSELSIYTRRNIYKYIKTSNKNNTWNMVTLNTKHKNTKHKSNETYIYTKHKTLFGQWILRLWRIQHENINTDRQNNNTLKHMTRKHET